MTLVIGVGNRWRGDDAAGLAVADAVIATVRIPNADDDHPRSGGGHGDGSGDRSMVRSRKCVAHEMHGS